MAKHPNSPQEKKDLAYAKDHFTHGKHSSFPHAWKKKKAKTNREFRRKAGELFSGIKTGMGAEDVSQITDDVTIARIQKSVTRKRLRKWGVTALGEKVPLTLERREERVNRRVLRRSTEYEKVAAAIATMILLEGESLVEFVRRFAVLSRGGDPIGYQRMMSSKNKLESALCFLYERQQWGHHSDVICVNEELKNALDSWIVKANRILARDRRAAERKQIKKEEAGKKINTLRRSKPASL